MESSGPLGSLFSPENRPWTLAIIAAVAALAAFLLLYDRDVSTGAEAGTTTTTTAAAVEDGSGATTAPDAADAATVTIADLPTVVGSEDCIQFATALSMAASGGIGASGQFDVTEVDQAFIRMSEVAPSEIADDLATMAAGFREFYSTLEQAGVDLADPASLTAPAAMAALEQANRSLESSGFVQASTNVSTWLEATCAGT